MKFLRTTAIAAALAVSGAAAVMAGHHETMGKTENPMVGGAPMYADKNIVENAVNSADHETLVAAVKAAGLVDTLTSPGPFTVFAPTDDAFAALPDGTVANLLKPENKATLQKVLTCHVVAGKTMSDALIGLIGNAGNALELKTVGGCTFTARLDDGMVKITDGQGNTAAVTIADVRQSNGVIHVIDTVLLPAS